MSKKMNAKTRLDNEIERLQNELAKLSPDAQEYAAVRGNLTELVNLRTEIAKAEADRMSWIGKILVELGLGAADLKLKHWGAKASFTFEEKGTISSQVGKRMWDRIFRK